jgi:hypothetical protein
LEQHKSSNHCWDHFDFGMLEAWDAKAEVFCSPKESAHPQVIAAKQTGSSLSIELSNTLPADASWLVCRVNRDEHLPPATAPHTMCDGANIAINFGTMRRAACPAFRPGYKCEGDAVFYHYDADTLQGACVRQPNFNQQSFPRDHLMDIFTSFKDSADISVAEPAEAPVTIFVTRERGEHGNLYHATTDFMNAFYT